MATNNPLTIRVDLVWEEHPSIVALREQGHRILRNDELGDDLILSMKAWNWNDSMWPYLEIALKAARKDKPKGIKKDGKQRKLGRGKNSDGAGKVSRRGRKAKSDTAVVIQSDSNKA